MYVREHMRMIINTLVRVSAAALGGTRVTRARVRCECTARRPSASARGAPMRTVHRR